MTKGAMTRCGKIRFSLLGLLTLTTILAIWIAVGLAYRTRESLHRKNDELLSLSSRLQVIDEEKLTIASLPRVATGFQTWRVHVPSGPAFDLRLGVGDVSKAGMLNDPKSIPLPAGRHRITLETAGPSSEAPRFIVHLDGTPTLDESIEPDRMPNGWDRSSGLQPPREPRDANAAPQQLSALSYLPRPDVGPGNYLSLQSDSWVTRPGYRLWIDRSNRSYEPASSFMGFDMRSHEGVGLRDGLRFNSNGRFGAPYQWSFTRPASGTGTHDSVLRIVPEFIRDGKTLLSDQTKSFQSWKLRQKASGDDGLAWALDPAETEGHAFLHAIDTSQDRTWPVVELKWDASRPNQVGLRLPDTPVNKSLDRWRLRVIDGTEHLWRVLRIDERSFEASDENDEELAKLSPRKNDNNPNTTSRIEWQTDETQPLQLLIKGQDSPKHYAGMKLYQGMPIQFALQFPNRLDPSIQVKRIKQNPDGSGQKFPGGPVFEEIQIELDATTHDWIWLEAKPTDKSSTKPRSKGGP